jgi:nitrite reductase (NADH) large subunit
LLASFLSLALLGGIAAALTALEAHIGGAAGRRLRAGWTQAHILIGWPLPVLLIFHILAAYYF